MSKTPSVWSEQRYKASDSAASVKQEHRTVFEQDYDRILFSSAVRRLSDKTQVFLLIVYDVQARALYVHSDFLNCVVEQTLEVNLWPNPSVKGNIVRAVRRLLKHDLTPGPQLSLFLDQNLSDDVFEHVVTTESKLYGWSYAEQYLRPSKLLVALKDRRLRETNRERQVEFGV